MEFIELAEKRRSVRKFTSQQIEKEKLEKILKATFTAPSSKNSRTTRIAVVTDPVLLEQISKMRTVGSSFVKDAPLAFIVMGDDIQTDLWRENCAISATILQFAAESLGLGSCWVHVNGRPHIDDDPDGITAAEYLHEIMPELASYRILCVVAVGYSSYEPKARPEQDDTGKVIFL